MKTMRKLFTVLLAMVMTLALAVPAFAAEPTGSITIANPQEGRVYTAYKIFDVTYSGENYSYTINKTDAAYSTVKAYADVPANVLTLTPVADTGKYNVSIGAKFSAASFAQHLKTNLKNNADCLGSGKAFSKVSNTVKASGLDLGYYFVSGTSGAVCELATAKDIKIHDKNEVPQIEKTVDGKNSTTANVGQVLNFKITGKVPSATGYTTYTYKVTDKMSDGLTFNNDVKVTIGGVDVTDATITKNGNGFVAGIPMMNHQDKIDEPVVVTYSAIVNDAAIKTDKETNTASLEYSNDPTTGTATKTEDITVPVYSFNIKIDKFASGKENTKLAGAKFVLKNNENKYYKYDEDAKKVSWGTDKAKATVVITDDKGAARFDGLQAGTYRLEETAAPDGYNQLTKDITIVITDKDRATVAGNASNPAADDLSLTAKVANSTGTVLPETGGTGTAIFVTLGALAVICAGVFLVTNKRMSKESF